MAEGETARIARIVAPRPTLRPTPVTDSTLLVADPPHVDVHARLASETLRLDPAVVESKARFRAPEVLMSGGEEECNTAARALRKAGLRVQVVEGRRLAGIPWPSVALSFALGSEGLVADTPEGVISVPWGTEVLGVLCRPPASFRPPEEATTSSPPIGPEVADAAQWGSVLDLYIQREEGIRRLLVTEAMTDFGGLGPAASVPARDAVSEAGRALYDRFEVLRLDTRFDDVRPRQRFRMGDESFDIDMRKAYSYGTLLLRQLLGSISPDLGELTQWEFASRLVHLLRSEG